MTEEGTPTESAPAENVSAPEAAPSDPIMERLNELSTQVGSLIQTPQTPTRPLADSLGDQPEPEQGNEAYQDDGYGYDDQYADPQVDEQQAIAQLQQFIQAQVQEGVNSQVTPWVHQQKAIQLEQKYPDLAKDAGPTLQAAQRRAEQINRPELARDPDFIELVYLAQRAGEQAQQETPAGASSEVSLEGGGAAPDQPEEDIATRIVNAGGGRPDFPWI